MQNYIKLNSLFDQSQQLVKPSNKLSNNTTGYQLLYPSDILSEYALKRIVELVGLPPIFVAIFTRQDITASHTTRMIHTDIQLAKTGNWQTITCGLNWELNETNNMFQWWDMGTIPEIFPPQLPDDKRLKLLNGIHFGKRNQLGIHEGATLLDSVNVKTPTLVRTDIPHSTTYTGVSKQRIGLSVRFAEPHNMSWENLYNSVKSRVASI